VGGGLNGDKLVYRLLISLQADPRASWGVPSAGLCKPGYSTSQGREVEMMDGAFTPSQTCSYCLTITPQTRAVVLVGVSA
jgi:hypothetical protein